MLESAAVCVSRPRSARSHSVSGLSEDEVPLLSRPVGPGIAGVSVRNQTGVSHPLGALLSEFRFRPSTFHPRRSSLSFESREHDVLKRLRCLVQ